MHRLVDVLSNRTWFNLRATAKAHWLHFNTNHSRAEATERLATQLDQRQLKRVLRQLLPAEKSALQSLHACGGMMPLHQFVALYGEIRPYKPWREDHHKFPWKRPISLAEKLYYLALVDILRTGNGQPDYVYTSQEVADLLPPLPRPHYHASTAHSRTPQMLCVDIAFLLGILLREEVKPMWGRWLAPRHLKAWNDLLPQPAPLGRSELQSDRLRFMHYLAQIAGLIALENGRLLPTVKAWTWLEEHPAEQWAQLWQAWHQDMQRGRNRQWEAFRLPALSRREWRAWVYTLGHAQPVDYDPHDVDQGRWVYDGGDLQTLIKAVRLRLPQQKIEDVPAPLWWGGLLWRTAEKDGYFSSQLSWRDSESLQLDVQSQAIGLHIPTWPQLAPLLRLMAIATPQAEGLCLDADSIKRALEQGHHATEVVRWLAEACQHPIDLSIYEQLAAWQEAASQFSLMPMVVLLGKDAQQLANLRQDRHLRPMIASSLGSRALQVHPHLAASLQARLERRGLAVQHHLYPDETSNLVHWHAASTAEYSYLSLRIVQQLGRLLKLKTEIPGAVIQEVGKALSAQQRAYLDQDAAALRDQMKLARDGYAPLMGGVTQDNPAAIRARVMQAYAARSSLRIRYFSPYEGAISERTIRPEVPIARLRGADYIEAWCELAQEPRTFRLDRIIAILDG